MTVKKEEPDYEEEAAGEDPIPMVGPLERKLRADKEQRERDAGIQAAPPGCQCEELGRQKGYHVGEAGNIENLKLCCLKYCYICSR